MYKSKTHIKNMRKPIKIHPNNIMPAKSSQVDDSKTREAEMMEKFSAQNLSVLPWWCIKMPCNDDITFSDLADVPIFF